MKRCWLISWEELELSIVYRGNVYLLNELLQDQLCLIQHHIHEFGYAFVYSWSQSCLQNMGIGKSLGGPANTQSRNDIMAQNTKQEDDAFSKQVKRLCEL